MSVSKRERSCEIAVVFDCNLFLQAVGKGKNHAFGCLKLVMEGRADLLMSLECLVEIDEVLRRPIIRERFPMLTDELVGSLVEWINEFAVFIDPVEQAFEYPIDPKDEPYINLAISGGAVFLVSWDNHIMRLRRDDLPEGKDFKTQYPMVAIMDPKEFLADFHSGQAFSNSYVDRIADRCKPINPITFRDACEELLSIAHERCKEDPTYRPAELSPLFFIEQYVDNDEAFSASMRFFAFLELFRNKDLTEFMRPGESENEREIHVAVFEAVATVPMNHEGKLLRGKFLQEVRNRVGEIALLSALLGDEDSDSEAET